MYIVIQHHEIFAYLCHGSYELVPLCQSSRLYRCSVYKYQVIRSTYAKIWDDTTQSPGLPFIHTANNIRYGLTAHLPTEATGYVDLPQRHCYRLYQVPMISIPLSDGLWFHLSTPQGWTYSRYPMGVPFPRVPKTTSLQFMPVYAGFVKAAFPISVLAKDTNPKSKSIVSRGRQGTADPHRHGKRMDLINKDPTTKPPSLNPGTDDHRPASQPVSQPAFALYCAHGGVLW